MILKPSQVRKRDGSIVEFKQEKIASAIQKALNETGEGGRGAADRLGGMVAAVVERKFAGKVPSVEDVQDAVEDALIKKGYSKTAKAYIIYRQKRAELRRLKEMAGVRDELKLSVNAVTVLKKRYLLRNEKMEVIETPAQMFRRVAKAVANVDLVYDNEADVTKVEEEFYNMMAALDFLPNSPTLMNAGLEIGQLSACFVLPVEDSLGGIFGSVRNSALIQQSGGGVGYSFSRLRPRGDVVKSTYGVASGPVSFMRIFDCVTNEIKQGSRRRGANMGILRVDHPDIVEFITAKSREGALSNFNLSVAVTDEFMDALGKGGEYCLVNPRNGAKVKKISAKSIFDLIVTMAWSNGDPGLLFIDEVNRHNPTPKLGEIEATNPCVAGDTLVSTNEGEVEIRNVHNPYAVRGIDGGLYPVRWAGKTGLKEIFRIKTKAGYELEATANHRILTQNGWKQVDELTRNDILVNGTVGFGSLNLNREMALMLGWLIGDGCITKGNQDVIFYFDDKSKVEILPYFKKYLDGINKKPIKPLVDGREVRLKYSSKMAEMFVKLGVKSVPAHEKEVPECIFRMNEEGAKNFLRALFTADGSIQGNSSKGVSVRLASSSHKLLKQVQILLLKFRVLSKVYENRRDASWRYLPDSKRRLKKYLCHADHELIISRESLFRFMEKIGFCISTKNKKFRSLRPSKVYKDNIDLSVEYVRPIGIKEVYDLTEPCTHSFVANGLVVHNCGEVPLLPYEVCNLGSINLSRFVDGKRGVDWGRLKAVVWSAVHFLDNVIDANNYPINETERIVKANRKIGLGVMGFADALVKMGVPYDSEKAVAFGEKLMSFISEEGRKASGELAKKRGSFPNFEGSVWRKMGFERMRNATVTTIAPTGTISIIANCSGGIEPLFAVSFAREVMDGARLPEVNPVFEKVAMRGGFYSEELMDEIAKAGSVQDVKGVPKEVMRVFVTALDIAPEWHVRMQAAFQKHVDNAVAKTVNLPEKASLEDVRKIYLLAHKLKCKGITVYRYGSREAQVLSVGSPAGKKGEHVVADSEYSGGCPTGECIL